MDFKHKLTQSWANSNSLLCVGLDPDRSKLPLYIQEKTEPLLFFNKKIIDATADLVCAFKLNSAMYEAEGKEGIEQLHKSCQYISVNYPDIPIILDFKRGDIGNTNNYYAQFAFGYLGVDAITINPYMGKLANESFLKYKQKGIMVLCRTSNPGAGEFQDLVVGDKKIYRIVAEEVMNKWDDNNNCLLVIGSPYPKEIREIRQALGDNVMFLIPGLGTQGGSAKRTVQAGVNASSTGVIINSSREIIYASSDKTFAAAARNKATQLRDEINGYRQLEKI